MEHFTSISWMGVISATVASFILGFVWFHPNVFGMTWAKSAQVELKPSSLAMVGTLLSTIILAIGFAFILRLTGWAGAMPGVGLGLLSVIIFIAPALIGQWFFMNRLPLFAVNIGFNVVNMIVIGLIIGKFQSV